MLRWGKEHIIGLIVGIVAYELYARSKTGGGGAQ
jgi:hypothetical protein